MPVRTLVVWCPDWPITAAGMGPDVPAAVLAANRVVASSAAARAEGVGRGLRKREAQARCPDLVVLDHDPGRDARAFEPVVVAVEAFAPRVEVIRPGSCALATRGPSRYFGGDAALVAKIAAAVCRASGQQCRIGIADGVFAAGLAARAQCVVAPKDTAAFLAPLPVRVLDRPDLVDLLLRFGIATMGAFAALPEADVLARFGPHGAGAHRLARGQDERPLAPRTPPPDLVVQRELDPPAQRVDTAAFVGKAMADDLHQRLAGRGLACTRVLIEAETEHGEHLARLWRHEGALTPAAIAERVRWQLDGWLARKALASAGDPAGDPADPEPTGGLTLLRLVPDEVVPDDGRQLGFWGGNAEAGERAARALARVQGLIGPDAVLTAVPSGGRHPGEQVTLVPWGDVRGPRTPPPPPPGWRVAARPDRTAAPAAPNCVDPADRTAPAGPTAPAAPTAPTAPAAPAAPDSIPRADGRGGRGRRRSATPSARLRWRERYPPWPGRVPAPAPATVYDEPVPAEVVDAAGRPVAVTGRGLVTAAPARLSIAGERWADVSGWAGPWPVDERWWDGGAHRRRARFQLLTVSGTAVLLSVQRGRWWVEGTYD